MRVVLTILCLMPSAAQLPLQLCAQTPPSATAPSSVITYQGPRTGAPWLQLDSGVSLIIHETAGCQFNRIRALVIQSTGVMVVANSGNTELCFFGSDGRFQRTVGRKGSGPGEYQSIFGLHALLADTLLVFDPVPRRLSVLAPDGEFVRSIPLQPPVGTLGSVALTATLRDGTIVIGFSEFTSGAPRPESVYFTQRLFRYGSDGRLLDALGRFPDSEHFIQATAPSLGGVAYWDRAFGRRLSFLPTRSGFLAGDGSDASLTEYSSAGHPLAVHRVAQPPRPITSADLATYRRISLAGVSGPGRAMEERRVAEMPFPQVYPAFRRGLTDPAGRVWLEEFPAPDAAASEWIVLDLAGRRAATLATPAGFRLLTVARTRVCGVARDADDLETVRCLGLRR